MQLPGGDKATVDPRKLSDYILNLNHPRGRHKARVFQSLLGIGTNQTALLEAALLAAARTGLATELENMLGFEHESLKLIIYMQRIHSVFKDKHGVVVDTVPLSPSTSS